MSARIVRGLGAVVGTAALIAACTGSPGGSPGSSTAAGGGGSDPGGRASAAAEATQAGGDVSAMSGCSLLTPAEIQQALGAAVKAGTFQTGNPEQVNCEWDGQDNRGEAAALLRRGTGVEPVAALLEVADDAFAVVDGVVVVVLELGVHPQHRQPDPADAGQHPPVRRLRRRPRVAWPPSGWKSASWAVRMSTLPWGSSTTVGRHTNCTAV